MIWRIEIHKGRSYRVFRTNAIIGNQRCTHCNEHARYLVSEWDEKHFFYFLCGEHGRRKVLELKLRGLEQEKQ